MLCPLQLRITRAIMPMAKSFRQHRQLDYTLGLCFVCNGYHDFDLEGQPELLLKCFDCHRNVHAICYQLDKASVEIVQTYDWQCNDCKSCLVCQSKNDESHIVICNLCDRGYHTFCCNPPLKSIPKDDWFCKDCTPSLFDSSASSPAQPLTPLSDSHTQRATAIYQLRRSPTHSAKFIENTVMAKEKKTIQKKKQSSDGADETKPTTRLEPLKLKLTVAESSATPSTVMKRKRGRTKQTAEQAEQDEEFFQTFGHKLTKIEANIKRGTPTETDVVKYEKAKHKAENLANKQQTKEQDFGNHDDDSDNEDNKSPGQQTDSEGTSSIDVPKIKQILFNNYLIDTWYVAPYPEEYSQSSTLYICEFCMKYMKSSFVADRHKAKCKVKYPPGDEIYRDDNVSVFEVDGRKNKIYCQNLCLMAKMFLDHKTLYYDVEPFLFYIMTEADDQGCHFVGYFSKEKRSAMNYNVSCILTMPIFQRKGYGQFLIDFSYLLSKRESKAGSPERPLSDLGLISYRSYWKNVLFHELENQDGSISIDELSHITSLTPDDIISTLENNNMIHHNKLTKQYSLAINPQVIKTHLHNLKQRNYLQLKPEKLKWTPFMLSQDRLAALLGHTKLTIKDTDESNDVDID